jgi:hypothetical protein
VRPAAWPSLAPIQRTVGEVPLTAPTVDFGRDLAGLRRPDLILRPLGHDVAADGPAGLVSGIATPLAAGPIVAGPLGATADQAALPPLPASSAPRGVQRRARTVSAARAPTPGADARTPAPVGGAQTEGAVPPTGADAATVALPAPAPRVLPVVAPSAVRPALAATRVAPATAPDPTRVTAPAAGPVTHLGPVTQPGPMTPAGPVAASGSGGSAQWSAASAPPSATPPDAPPGQVVGAEPVSAPQRVDGGATALSGHHSLGASRRLGLGAPLAGRTSVQRIAAGPDLPLVRAGRAPVPAAIAPAPASPVRRVAAATTTTLPVLRVASDASRRAVSGGPGDGRRGRQATGAWPAPPLDARPHVDIDAGPAPRTAPDPERPLVGDTGRRVVSSFVEGADVDAGSDPVGPGLGAPGELPVPAGTASPVTGGAGPRSSDTPVAAPAAAPVAVSRGTIQPAPNHQPTPTPTVSVGRATPLVVARSLRSSDPFRSGAGPAGVPGHAMARLGGGHAGSDHVTTTAPATHGAPGSPAAGGRRSGMPVARAASFPGLPVNAGAAIEEPVSVSRFADTGGFASPPPDVMGWSATSGFAVSERAGAGVPAIQRAVAIDEMSTGVAAAAAAPAAGDSGSAGAGGAGQDYEEMADRVYDRIRSRFATELLLDRERMGLLIDG